MDTQQTPTLPSSNFIQMLLFPLQNQSFFDRDLIINDINRLHLQRSKSEQTGDHWFKRGFLILLISAFCLCSIALYGAHTNLSFTGPLFYLVAVSISLVLVAAYACFRHSAYHHMCRDIEESKINIKNVCLHFNEDTFSKLELSASQIFTLMLAPYGSYGEAAELRKSLKTAWSALSVTLPVAGMYVAK